MELEREVEGLTDAAMTKSKALEEALDHIEHLLKGPGTHYHSTDTQPGCTGCEGEYRFGEAREFLKRHGRKTDR
jgi:hypothetical protein